jgi:putative redox protein
MITALIGKDQYKTELITSGHYLIADEPADKKGTNLGPAPHEFLFAALASCTAITLRMYADRKKWPIDQIKVDVTSEITKEKTIFKREISFDGTLDESQRNRLLQIANSCPVHMTLTNPIEINTELLVAS